MPEVIINLVLSVIIVVSGGAFGYALRVVQEQEKNNAKEIV